MMAEQCIECAKHAGLAKDFYMLRDRVQNNEDFYKPIADKANMIMNDYPNVIKVLTDKVAELDKQNIIENSKLDAIHLRMDKHDRDEEEKRKERLEDRRIIMQEREDNKRANRTNVIVIAIFLISGFGTVLVTMFNMNNSYIHYQSQVDKRMSKIENVLGIGK